MQTRRRSTALKRLSLRQRRHRVRYGVEDWRPFALLLLQFLPVAQDICRTSDDDIAENVWVPSH